LKSFVYFLAAATTTTVCECILDSVFFIIQSILAIACSNTAHGSLAFQNGSKPTAWTSYSSSFSASKSASTLVFGFQTDGTNTFYLDDVSVVDTNALGIQLLNNPSFENSTSTPPTGWIVSCELTSCGASATSILSGSTCSSGYYFENFCTAGRSSLIFLSQTFSTTSGDVHTISYKLKRTAISSTEIMVFYLDVIQRHERFFFLFLLI
jgi:hypothetical protein